MNIAKEVATLQRQSVKQLRERYAELFGETTLTANKTWLIKRIAWRLQSQAEGGLSERAKKRAAELAKEADLRLSPPRSGAAETMTASGSLSSSFSRLPLPGSIISRNYKGQIIRVIVLANGFEYAGEVYKSLSAVAKTITGSHINGFLFFRLGKEKA